MYYTLVRANNTCSKKLIDKIDSLNTRHDLDTWLFNFVLNSIQLQYPPPLGSLVATVLWVHTNLPPSAWRHQVLETAPWCLHHCCTWYPTYIRYHFITCYPFSAYACSAALNYLQLLLQVIPPQSMSLFLGLSEDLQYQGGCLCSTTTLVLQSPPQALYNTVILWFVFARTRVKCEFSECVPTDCT